MRGRAESNRITSWFRPRRWAVTVAVLVLIVPSVGVASSHCGLRHLFVYNPIIPNARGQATTVWIVDFNPDFTCPFTSNRHHTAHVREVVWGILGWAEVGYWRGLDGANTEHTWVFWEVKNYVTGQVTNAFFGTAAVNLWARFKVEINPSNGFWRFWWDRGLSGTYARIGPSGGVDAGFVAGSPMGETAFLGSVDSTDTHDNLWYQSLAYAWNPWANQAKEIDEIQTSHWHLLSPKSYRVHAPNEQH